MRSMDTAIPGPAPSTDGPWIRSRRFDVVGQFLRDGLEEALLVSHDVRDSDGVVRGDGLEEALGVV